MVDGALLCAYSWSTFHVQLTLQATREEQPALIHQVSVLKLVKKVLNLAETSYKPLQRLQIPREIDGLLSQTLTLANIEEKRNLHR